MLSSRHVFINDPTSQETTVPAATTADEFSALTALIQDRGARWSKKARAIKFDIEFKAIEHERRRVAKELHDEILPSLARLIRSIQANDARTVALVEELHNTVAAFRDLLGELHPVDLEELGLVPALSNICKRYARNTNRCVVFTEVTEECNLSALQQLCLYRAVQSVLKMFADSDNDILVVHYNRDSNSSVIKIRCVDKRVSSAAWLSPDKPEYELFESWCGMAGAALRFRPEEDEEFPCDLAVSVCEAQPPAEDIHTLIGQLTQIRLHELDTIVAFAQEEWANLINRDCSLFRTLAIDAERKKISEAIDRGIRPNLNRTIELVGSAEALSEATKNEVVNRLQTIGTGIGEVMAELHARLLEEAGFMPSIRALVDRFRCASMIPTTILSSPTTDEVDICLEAKFAIYRVIQEALNNIEKHSDASCAMVTVRCSVEKLIISIEDNGKGIAGTQRNVLARGVRNIRERAEEIGAIVAWVPARSFTTGTLVTITLNIEDG